VTGKADFTPEEWNLVREGPPGAGLIVLMAASGGSFRESWALAKTFAEARKQHGESELVDALVAEKPDLKRYHSAEEAEQQGLQRLGEAVSLLEQKASPEEVESYKRFTLTVAERVAEAHQEGGEATSAAEREAIQKITTTLG
jgi:type I site-specific restriction endonuclease